MRIKSIEAQNSHVGVLERCAGSNRMPVWMSSSLDHGSELKGLSPIGIPTHHFHVIKIFKNKLRTQGELAVHSSNISLPDKSHLPKPNLNDYRHSSYITPAFLKL
ncbi:hypothetical protein TNCV_1232941 [Trichonephila clavipes]|nr:hypothetical protein TNCV_1232941 [Trichonephila clavipes]